MLYCMPVLQGKVLHAGDVNNWKGTAQEARMFYEENGYSPWWTNSQFGGMPTYQMTGALPSSHILGTTLTISRAGFSGNLEVIGLIFAYLMGFFLLLLCFGINPWLSIVGAFALTLSTYFMLIIPAGHITKAAALASLAPVVGGVYAILHRRYTLGIPIVLIYGFISVTLHPQMAYYLCMLDEFDVLRGIITIPMSILARFELVELRFPIAQVRSGETCHLPYLFHRII